MNRIEKHLKTYKTVKQLAAKVRHIRDDNVQVANIYLKLNIKLFGMN